MSHTLHRYGISEADLQDDFIVFAIAAQTVNAKGIHPEFNVFEQIVMKYGPVNYGDMRQGNIFNAGLAASERQYYDNSIVHAVFTDEDTVVKVLKDLYAADLHLSIVVSGLTERTAACCREAGIAPHTVEHSMGIWGKTELLPSEDILRVSTMCGHGMISFSLIKDLSGKVARGALTAKQASEKLAGLCHCGVFNPVRAARIIEKIAADLRTQA